MSSHTTPRDSDAAAAAAPDTVSAHHDTMTAPSPHSGSAAVSPNEVMRGEQLTAIAARGDDAAAAACAIEEHHHHDDAYDDGDDNDDHHDSATPPEVYDEHDDNNEEAFADEHEAEAGAATPMQHHDEHNARALQHLDAAIADEEAAERHADAAAAAADDAAAMHDAEAGEDAAYHMHQANLHAAASDAHTTAAMREAVAAVHDHDYEGATHEVAQHTSEPRRHSRRSSAGEQHDDAAAAAGAVQQATMVVMTHVHTDMPPRELRSRSHSEPRSHSHSEEVAHAHSEDDDAAAAAVVAHTVEHLDDDFLSHALPSLETLRAARVQLTEQIRHHKDEQDSLALDIEGQEGAAELYHFAARLQRLEHFCAQAHAHVTEKMTREVEQVLEMDKRHSDEEIAAYAKALQAKRDKVMKKLATAKAKPMNGRAENAKQHVAQIKLDDKDVQTMQQVAENEETAASLAAKVKKFRTMKSKLEAEIVSAERNARHASEVAALELKRAQLDSSRDARQCGELNANNATMTTAAQLLLSQLNAAHYGLDGAPTTRQLIEAYKAINATPPLTPNEANDGQQRNGDNNNGGGGALINAQSSESVHSAASRQSLTRPPLVALKSTASQRSRDSIARKERAETRASSRRSSDVAGGSATHGERRPLPLAPRRESLS